MGKVARKEAVMEASLFVILTEAMEQPSVQKWIAEKANMIKYSGREDIRGLVEKEGYEWGNVKEIFYSDGTAPDNVKLKQAWEKEWRPELGRDWLFKNPKYQTKTFKSLLSKPKRIAALRSDNTDFKEKEGVQYFDSEEGVRIYNQIDSNVTDEDIDAASSELDKYL